MLSKQINAKIEKLIVKRLVLDYNGDHIGAALVAAEIEEAKQDLAEAWVMEKLESNL